MEKNDKLKALDAAISQIERQYGKGAVMKLGDPAAPLPYCLSICDIAASSAFNLSSLSIFVLLFQNKCFSIKTS